MPQFSVPLLPWALRVLFLAAPALSAATIDLLDQENRDHWLTIAGKPGQISIQPSDKSKAFRVFREDGFLENTALLAYFDRKGLLPHASAKSADVTLAKVGDSLGVRAVLSYNPGARFHIYNQAMRLALGNSQGTRLATHRHTLSSPEFVDDAAWLMVLSVDSPKSSFLRRSPATKTSFPASSMGAITEKEWTATIAKPVFQSGAKVEIVFSVTRTGPDSVRLYGFVQGVEQEHVAQGVSDFTFDTVCLFYPVPRTNAPAEMTLHELQIVTLP